ncbi:MAG: 4Fe-4S dicluster domain-containing protein [Lentisphaerae bacterium]|nr:4Fe-4S dicluster domain-containing protein [Lentisphaerota bacterium]
MKNKISSKNLLSRRQFLDFCRKAVPTGLLLVTAGAGRAGGPGHSVADPASAGGEGQGTLRPFGMAIDIRKCIGCGRCVNACKIENNVPREPLYFRTWVERYILPAEGEPKVDSPNGGLDGFPEIAESNSVLKSFFVPKLCNHCANPPCVQVCPVGATFQSPDGVVLVDQKYCVGCRYCIQACPYGARYLHPEKLTADKCTFCYHRIKKDLLPACVEVCPTQARVFGEIGSHSSPLWRFIRANATTILKAELNTRPNVFYAGASSEVR